MSIIYRSNQAMTNPPANAPVAPGRTSVLSVFGLGDVDDIVGQRTSDGDGLEMTYWEGDPGMWSVRDGNLVPTPGTGRGTVGVPIYSSVGASVSWLVRQSQDTERWYMDLFTPMVLGGDLYRIIVEGETMWVAVRINNVSTNLTPALSVPIGHRLGLRWLGGVLSLMVDGKAVQSFQDARVAPGGYAGLSLNTNHAELVKLDDLQVDVF